MCHLATKKTRKSHSPTKEKRMSHSATFKIQPVTNTYTVITINIEYLKSPSGILQLLQVALGILAMGMAIWARTDGDRKWGEAYYPFTPNNDFLVATTLATITVFILFLSRLFYLSNFSVKLALEELICCVIHLAMNVYLPTMYIISVPIDDRNELLMGAAICTLVNAGLYFFHAIILAQYLSMLVSGIP